MFSASIWMPRIATTLGAIATGSGIGRVMMIPAAATTASVRISSVRKTLMARLGMFMTSSFTALNEEKMD
jgi:hypothetical protein